MDHRKRSRREGGFTLIELISVIIILGILAAVVVPKYFDMTGKANDAAYKGALAEGSARFNMSYAKYIMDTNAAPASLGVLQVASYLGGATTDLGDYIITYSGGSNGTDVTMTLTKDGDNASLKWSNNTTPVASSFPWPQ